MSSPKGIDQLLLEESVLKAKIEKLIANGKRRAIARRTQGFFETTIAELKRLWLEYEKIDLQIHTESAHNPAEKANEYIADEVFDKLQEKYHVTKLYHLKACLTDDAERVLRHTPITADSYEPAWKKLRERYENKRILVNHQLNALTMQPKMQGESAKGMKVLLDTTDECLQQLKALDVDTSSWDAIIVFLLVQKLPFQTFRLWEEEQGSSQTLPTIKQFTKFLDTRLKVLESIADALTPKAPPYKQVPKPSSTQVHHALKADTCPACNARHFIQKCPKYLQMQPLARRNLISTAKRCLNCLSRAHQISDCSSKNRCFKCNQAHHTTLHEDAKEQGPATSSHWESHQVKAQTSLGQAGTSHTFTARENPHVLLSTALVHVQANQHQPLVLRCLIDPGSQSSFITESACKLLQASFSPTAVTITGLTVSPAATATKQTMLKLKSCGNNKTTLEEEFLVLNSITDTLPRIPIPRKDFDQFTDLQLADATFAQPGKIDVLLSARIYAKIMQEGVRKPSGSSLTALSTLFGWILIGSVTTHQQECQTFLTTNADVQLNTNMQKFWEIEEILPKSLLTPEEIKCEQIFIQEHKRLHNGQYEVKLPFINNTEPILGKSKHQAIKRFQNLEQKFKKNPQLEKDYTKCMNEYLELGHMDEVKVPSEELPHYYIPHHAVFKDSSTTKLRVVFDASCKTTNQQSLNDWLLKGPTLQPKLFATLLNWRKYRIALNADVEKMYRMIKVHPDHRKYQRIIWRNPETQLIQEYELNTVTFGTSAAPYLAIKTVQQLAQDEEKRWPAAAKAVKENFYVDDLLTGTDDIRSAKLLQQELVNMFTAGGFNLRKWASNSSEVLKPIPTEYRELKESLIFSEEDTIKTLGIQWHPGIDHFSYKYTPTNERQQTTKRTMLSAIASLYDPLGWLSPVIVRAKLMMQALWITGSDWDKEVTESMESDWKTFRADLHKLALLKIPRWVRYSIDKDMQVHGFCDASAKAYAAVVYLRTQTSDGSISSMLLTAKTKVAPTKPVTIPRLELNGAVLLTRLIKNVTIDMKLQNIPVFAWCDSTIVLQWIKEHPSRWKTYVANRVVEIQETIKYENWQHVATSCNPADIASRGTTVEGLIKDDLWWHGPNWLREPQNNWPCIPKVSHNTTLEEKPTAVSLTTQTENSFLKQYSSYTKLLRITALLRRFVHNTRKEEGKVTGNISRHEQEDAEYTILKLIQQSYYRKEYVRLTRGESIPKESKLLGLNLFVDDRGVMRVGGRIDNATISYNQRHPIIIPKGSYIAALIINRTHRETLHGGPALVLATTRAKYWIVDARRTITTQIHKCVKCFRFRKEATSQLMGNLPASRVNVSRPFSHVGVDYAGPFTINASPLRNAKRLKAYICIFVCMATKAIHVEFVSSLTSEAYIAAFKRFVGRRGLCADIYSDCGSNFIGGKSILDADLKKAIKSAEEQAAKFASFKQINWHFNPPASPHFGGIWEAGVKSIKYHLQRTLGNMICTFEEYATMLTQIEACLNSRLLCYISNSADESMILTPGHFLIGEALNSIPEENLMSVSIPSGLRWKLTQQKVQNFWSKWNKDYLNQLQNRPKWQTKERNFKIGDIVLLKNENTPPATWPLARVERLYKGTDGLVRVVELQTQNTILKRPITKVVKLPIETQEGSATNNETD